MEREVKILDIDIESIRSKMTGLGAEKVKDEIQENRIFDFEDGRLLNDHGYARIRIVQDEEKRETIFMTTKKMVSQDTFKIMEEHEVVISSASEGEGIFHALGLHLIQTIHKTRESYRYKNTLVEIDVNDKSFVPFPYLEVESPNEEELMEVVALLGYRMEDTSSLTIYDILRERGIAPSAPKGL